jgi:hypothetical protein
MLAGIYTIEAECERIMLAQAEYRGEIDLNLFEWFSRQRAIGDAEKSFSGFSVKGEWVVFADGGRGWLVGPRDASNLPFPERQYPDLQYPAQSLPPLGTYRADVGAGLDFGVLGVFIAKAVSKGNEPLNYFVRVRHRF